MKLSHITEAKLSTQMVDLVGSFTGEGVDTITADNVSIRLKILYLSKVFSTLHSKQYQVEIVRVRNAPKIVAKYIQQHSGDDITYEVYDDDS